MLVCRTSNSFSSASNKRIRTRIYDTTLEYTILHVGEVNVEGFSIVAVELIKQFT